MDKDTITKLAAPLTKDVLSRLLRHMASNATSNIIYKLERKITGQRDVDAGKKFFLSISNKAIDDIIEIQGGPKNTLYFVFRLKVVF